MLRNVKLSLTAVPRRGPARLARFRAVSTTISSEPTSSIASAVLHDASTSQKQKQKAQRSAEGEEKDVPKRLLKPYVLSARLTKLCGEGKIDEAVEVLKNMPLDAQNVSVWSSLINQVGRRGRCQLAYSLFIEMKRRGFKPDMRSYATILAAFTRITDWTNRHKLLLNAHTLYENYLDYLNTVKAHNPDSPELSIIPVNAYLTILARAREAQRLFDVYNAICDTNYPVPPNNITYTMLLRSCGMRSIDARNDDPTSESTRARAASDARLIWRQMLQKMENGADISIDALVLDAYLVPLTLGRPADQIIAFDILHDYAGLAKPGESAPPATVELSPILLADAFWLCNVTKKYRLCTHWAHQLMEQKPSALDRRHMDHVLSAYGSLAAMGSLTEAPHALQILEWMFEQEAAGTHDQGILPALSTFTLVLTVCWRGKDWESTLRTFELMSGYRAEDFADGATGEPQMVQRSRGRNILPDAAAMSCIVRTALESGDPANMRQCLRIVRHLGLKQYLQPAEEGESEKNKRSRAAARFESDMYYYAHKTARALVELVDELVPRKTGDSPPLSDADREWVTLRTEARTFLVAQRDHRPQNTPQLEEQPLGSERGLAAVDDVVQWERMSRETKNVKNR